MRICSLLLVLLVLAAAQPSARAYTYGEILDIYRMSGRKLLRDGKLARALRLLRDSRVLYMKSADVGTLVARVERPEILAALATLHDAGLLPRASTAADTIHVENDVLTTEPPAKKTRPIYQPARVVKPIPFYEFIDFKNYYILGGMLDAGTEFEVVNVQREQVALVSFEKQQPGFIAMSHVAELAPPSFHARQDPAAVSEKASLGGATFYRAVHEYEPGKQARLSILWVPLERGLSVRPYVTSAYDLTAHGPTQVEPIDEMARAAGALAAVNGTFFINAPRSPGWGKPLGPIVVDGKTAWSYNEARVLKMNRAYLAVTTDNRAVLGETNQPTSQILAADAQGRFLPPPFSGARIRHLLGGFGWLMKDGDEFAWQRYAGAQFWYTYYSYHTKRPQTVLGVTADGRGLVMIAQEGMPHSSRPMSLPMLSRYLKANFPVKNAVFLDGGGSTEMVLSGRPVTRQEGNGAYRKNSTALMVVQR